MEKKIQTKLPLWILHVDGASNQQGSGAGLVLTLPEDDETQYALWFGFKASNNEAGYEALLAGLSLASELGVKQLRIFSGSQLVHMESYLRTKQKLDVYGIVIDNGKQFDNGKFCELAAELNIKHFFASPTHPQAINKLIKKNLKTRLKEHVLNYYPKSFGRTELHSEHPRGTPHES
ncbi:unnamed protein product [Prunus brigantina]